jgi:hypothetical protein
VGQLFMVAAYRIKMIYYDAIEKLITENKIEDSRRTSVRQANLTNRYQSKSKHLFIGIDAEWGLNASRFNLYLSMEYDSWCSSGYEFNRN